MGAAYLTVPEWAELSIMQDSDIAALEIESPGYLAARIIARSAEVDARLAKRYAVPFPAAAGSEPRVLRDANGNVVSTTQLPVIVGPPVMVKRWVESLVTFDAYGARGFNPSSSQDQAVIIDPYARTLDELKEAADSVQGLYDLPMRADLPGTSGIVRGAPLAYSEADAYEWTDAQAEAIGYVSTGYRGRYG